MRKFVLILSMIVLSFGLMSNSGCERNEAQTDSGIKKVTAEIKTGSDGLTVEQRQIKKRIKRDNEPGSIKHLYIISAYSGQVLIYSTVQGKVTSSGKKLTPRSVNGNGYDNTGASNFVNFGGNAYTTNEMIEEDGTYGSSIEYIYWFDQRDVYHQHYISGGQILHISDQPLEVKDVILNMEIAESNKKK